MNKTDVRLALCRQIHIALYMRTIFINILTCCQFILYYSHFYEILHSYNKCITLMRHFFSVKREVEVDECPKCGGFWLDYGELGQIRGQFSSEEERKKAAQAYCGKVLDGGLQKMGEGGEESRKKARKMSRMFRFVMPK